MDVRAAFVAQREAAEAMEPGQSAFDSPAEDAAAAAMRTAGLGGPRTLPAPWTPRTHPPPSLLVMTLRTDKRRRACARLGLTRYSQPCRWLVFKRSVIHFVREHDESMKPPSNVKTPAQYIASLPADRAKTIATVRALVNKHIPRGYDECLVWGTIGWTIPLSRYPDTYNKQPICYVALSSQKNYCSLYLMGAFWSASQLEQLKAAFKAAGKKLDMGKCCVHFESPDDLPLEAIGKLISAISSEKWIEMYEQSRLMTKAGQAQMAKQGAPSASKVAAKRVDAKRRR